MRCMSPVKKVTSNKKIRAKDRRQKIFLAAIPLFAEYGIKATTTKAIAQAAGVSEALLYQHFASKDELFSELGVFICSKHDKILKKIKELRPSTSTLINIIYFLVADIAQEEAPLQQFKKMVQHILLDSCMTDGKFARFFFNDRMKQLMPIIIKSMQAAAKTGDMLIPIGQLTAAKNRIWFSHQLALAVTLMRKNNVIDYHNQKNMVSELAYFILRGLGLKTSAIKKYFHPKTLGLMTMSLMASTFNQEVDALCE